MGLKLLCWWNYVDCYNVLHRNLMVSRDYELIIYRIIGVTNSFLSVDMRYMMVWIGSWKMVFENLREVDIVIQLFYLNGKVFLDW